MRIKEFGCFVDIGSESVGLVHISQLKAMPYLFPAIVAIFIWPRLPPSLCKAILKRAIFGTVRMIVVVRSLGTHLASRNLFADPHGLLADMRHRSVARFGNKILEERSPHPA